MKGCAPPQGLPPEKTQHALMDSLTLALAVAVRNIAPKRRLYVSHAWGLDQSPSFPGCFCLLYDKRNTMDSPRSYRPSEESDLSKSRDERQKSEETASDKEKEKERRKGTGAPPPSFLRKLSLASVHSPSESRCSSPGGLKEFEHLSIPPQSLWGEDRASHPDRAEVSLPRLALSRLEKELKNVVSSDFEISVEEWDMGQAAAELERNAQDLCGRFLAELSASRGALGLPRATVSLARCNGTVTLWAGGGAPLLKSTGALPSCLELHARGKGFVLSVAWPHLIGPSFGFHNSPPCGALASPQLHPLSSPRKNLLSLSAADSQSRASVSMSDEREDKDTAGKGAKGGGPYLASLNVTMPRGGGASPAAAGLVGRGGSSVTASHPEPPRSPGSSPLPPCGSIPAAPTQTHTETETGAGAGSGPVPMEIVGGWSAENLPDPSSSLVPGGGDAPLSASADREKETRTKLRRPPPHPHTQTAASSSGQVVGQGPSGSGDTHTAAAGGGHLQPQQTQDSLQPARKKPKTQGPEPPSSSSSGVPPAAPFVSSLSMEEEGLSVNPPPQTVNRLPSSSTLLPFSLPSPEKEKMPAPNWAHPSRGDKEGTRGVGPPSSPPPQRSASGGMGGIQRGVSGSGPSPLSLSGGMLAPPPLGRGDSLGGGGFAREGSGLFSAASSDTPMGSPSRSPSPLPAVPSGAERERERGTSSPSAPTFQGGQRSPLKLPIRAASSAGGGGFLSISGAGAQGQGAAQSLPLGSVIRMPLPLTALGEGTPSLALNGRVMGGEEVLLRSMSCRSWVDPSESPRVTPRSETIEDFRRVARSVEKMEVWRAEARLTTLREVNAKVKAGAGHAGASELVAQGDVWHDRQIEEICQLVTQRVAVRVISVAGPTSSGKTRLAMRLEEALRERGAVTALISTDDFYKSQNDPTVPRLKSSVSVSVSGSMPPEGGLPSSSSSSSSSSGAGGGSTAASLTVTATATASSSIQGQTQQQQQQGGQTQQLDWESIQALRLPKLQDTLKRLLDGERVEIPSRDWGSGEPLDASGRFACLSEPIAFQQSFPPSPQPQLGEGGTGAEAVSRARDQLASGDGGERGDGRSASSSSPHHMERQGGTGGCGAPSASSASCAQQLPSLPSRGGASSSSPSCPPEEMEKEGERRRQMGLVQEHAQWLRGRQLVVVEGLFCLNPLLYPAEINDSVRLGVFVLPLVPPRLSDLSFASNHTCRLIRRLVRDAVWRGYSPLETLQRWQAVREGEERNVFPFVPHADFVFDSSHPAEAGILCRKAAEALAGGSAEGEGEGVNTDALGGDLAERVKCIRRLSVFALPVPSRLIARRSLLAEFIDLDAASRQQSSEALASV
uniref:Phosphoribulokinase/uridine kinase domain-containing protein n=1 Tax=Chromera velia CCMP2878 TaxID=1169474 RepID=A0A0G4GAF5_9ALVE|eukprot:Cvel_20986.t1-p1 / transcript=Cvel_20986.t1 / gene=Cvel_20986 / organism=Chromera_velia_CCMP2878 / gene_product=hypothetical protein / transcript_product=hypothetical protein / location=Cvel_scaffold1931:24919-34860(-) / protein_length=1351 / sequence_SO=supercontig / SO=protein_coding / is_pseudo=false